MSDNLQYHLINAFSTGSQASGNQAAVIILPKDHPKIKEDDWKLKIANNFGFPESAFIYPIDDGKWSLRWWTPEVVSHPIKSFSKYHKIYQSYEMLIKLRK